MSVSADPKFLDSIRAGYTDDPFAQRVLRNLSSMDGASLVDGLLFISGHLVVPCVTAIQEALFLLAHDSLGHFGADKSYAALRSSYYWPGMRADLENSFLPSCASCQWNKSIPSKLSGPLHPLPIPDCRGDSVAVDFIGPLPPDSGFDSLITMTCRSGSDIRLIPTSSTLTAKGFASLFYDHWYCENGLPLDIVSNRDKLFISRFWAEFTRLAGIKLKMSSAFHPQTDSASEQTNKTINQCLRFHVDRNQTGWVRALPRVHFHLMNSVNSSTGFSPFQLCMGRSPRIIPPLTMRPTMTPLGPSAASALIDRIHLDSLTAADALLATKVSQAEFANRHRKPGPTFRIGDCILLSTFHRRCDFHSRNTSRVAKFMPCYDGPYTVTHAHPGKSCYTLNLPNSDHTFPTFHSSLLRAFHDNDSSLFPSHHLPHPGPYVTADGIEEFVVDLILDERRHGRGHQYLVQWKGWGLDDARWLPRRELKDYVALDAWLSRSTTTPAEDRPPVTPTKHARLA